MKYNLSEMKCLDIYLSNLPKEEHKKAVQTIKPSGVKQMPLLSWDLFMEGYQNRLFEAKKKVEIKEVISLAEKFNWRNDLNTLFEENKYDAIVITDLSQKIIWVNDGFTTMTGYSKKFAMYKTPKFLQGEKTLQETKRRFSEKITADKPFKEVIINYKKDKTPYNCEVRIIPLFNDQTTHFIAFEREVI